MARRATGWLSPVTRTASRNQHHPGARRHPSSTEEGSYFHNCGTAVPRNSPEEFASLGGDARCWPKSGGHRPSLQRTVPRSPLISAHLHRLPLCKLSSSPRRAACPMLYWSGCGASEMLSGRIDPGSNRGVKSRRGVRVAEGARLESVFTSNRDVGSNPTLSASLLYFGFCARIW